MPRLFGRFAHVAACCLVVLGSSHALLAADAKKPLKPGEYNPSNDTVELFDAMKAGQIEVKVIHKNEASGKLLFSNKTDKALNVKLPAKFATVHVLAQFGGGGGVGSTGGIGGGLGQSTGGGMGGGGMGGGGMGGGAAGGGGGMFNVAPEKVGQLPFTSVCLEHGKPNPKSSMKYEIRPLESVASDAEVGELISMLNAGTVSQRVAQVLAWHLNNEMSFQELAAKTIRRLDGTSYPYFNPVEIQAAMAAKDHIVRQIAEKAEKKATAAVELPKL